MNLKRALHVWFRVFVDYCSNCSLAGLGYIANNKYHYTERLFWLGCVLLSWTGSYFLIATFMETFRKNAVSMVIENVHPREVTNFPSVGICEMGYAKEVYESLVDIIEEMKSTEDMEYNYDVEDFMLRIIFHNLYNYGSIMSYCAPYKDCDDCLKCPVDKYNEYAAKVRANCTQLFEECTWNGIKFDCCRYFKPIQTTMGSCYLMNSAQLVQKGGRSWFRMEVGRGVASGELLLNISKASSAYILNEEDIPHMLLTTLQFTQMPEGYAGTIFFTVKNIVNDPLVRTVDTEIRRCVFPDEENDSGYPKYSYSVCVTECLKQAQIKLCNCCHHNVITNDNDKSLICGYDGLFCLDQKDLMFPQTTIMQPWRTNGLVCKCLPSCSEHEIRVIGKQSVIENRNDRSVSFKLLALPTQRYRRQIVRENLDVVVSVGGILGLFMGASILSLVELVYFFTVRLVSTSYQITLDEEENDDDEEEDEHDMEMEFR
ncbi:sodium channel protein Nach [Toxorhynchites rutilus septentrionalis]|uniref:sodium channel protein Nach n=1 Tax=Toxorhynchites rutilus septentrionalis TaxID=329112 RepID=UPI002478C6B0|nr:sodium channel protein Nach [Toxorhynchites rutilus septentrionalis]